MKKVKIIVVMLSILLVGFCGEKAFAYDQDYELKEYQFDDETGNSIIDRPIVPQTKQETGLFRKSLPEKFDFNTGNVQTATRNQGSLGFCWAYSAVDTVTISNKKEFGTEYSLSPNYYNYYSATNGFTDSKNLFGTRWLNSGGDPESVLVQNHVGNVGTLEKDFFTPLDERSNRPMLLQEFKNIQTRKSPVSVEGIETIHGIPYADFTTEEQLLKIDKIKRAIYERGAVSFSYNTVASHNPKYFNLDKKASFVSPQDVKTALVPTVNDQMLKTNHAIVIVGWDNAFSRDNFTIKPESDGAFLVKNSWGGDPYFYISYEDVYILNSRNMAVNTKMTTFDKINTYVNTRADRYVTIENYNRTVYIGNVYKTENLKEQLKAVSFHSEQAGVAYEVFFSDKAIRSKTYGDINEMKKIAKGTLEVPGMKEIPTEPIEVDKNKEYSVIIKMVYPKDVPHFTLFMQSVKDANEGNYPNLKEGKSFLSTESTPNNMYWRGVSNGDTYKNHNNLFLNAYTDLVKEVSVTGISVSSPKKELKVGEQVQLTASITPENATNKKVTWTSSNNDTATVSEEGIILAKHEGIATITSQTQDGNKEATIQIKINPEDKYGTAPWTWEAETQTLTFGEGAFPQSTSSTGELYEKIQRTSLNNKPIKHIRFTKKIKAHKQSNHLFGYLNYLESIDNIELLDTSEVADMTGMFLVTDNLPSLDLSSWDTSNVVNMSYMFSGSSIKTLNVSNWDTSQVTDMKGTFSQTHNLKELNLVKWDTSKVQDMSFMFGTTVGLKTLDLSNFDTSNVTTMYGMFFATGIESLDLSNFDTSDATMTGMFQSSRKINKMTLGKKTILKPNCSLLEGRWVSQNQLVVYNSTDELIDNYNGSLVGVYYRTE